MKKRFKWILGLACLSALCLTVAACGKETKEDEMAKQGYVISVTYDPSGGSFFNISGVTLTDYFNPNAFTEDEETGEISIKLLDPLDEKRTQDENGKNNGNGAPTVTLGKSGYSLVGWYTNREIVKNENGDVLNESGVVLTQKFDGSYYYLNEKGEQVESLPAYEYSGLWDFDTARLSYNAAEHQETDGRMSVTLYAGWLPYFQFEYLYQNDEGQWTSYGKTSFDYLSNKEANTDRDTIWVPRWQNETTQSGAMNYTHSYATSSSSYTFPALNGTTFKKAYVDQECTQEITGSFVHQGTISADPCRAINSVQKIYVVLDKGERYRVTTAAELCDNGNAEGQYEILNNIDLTGYNWPAAFTTSTFTGKFYAAEGTSGVTISNAVTTVTTEGDAYGGLFGYVAAGAEIKNVTFENATVNVASVTNERGQSTALGLLAGEIDEKATVTGVQLKGCVLQIKDEESRVGFSMAGEWKLNAVANGNTSGVGHTKITVIFVAIEFTDYFKYTLKPDTIAIGENGNITFQLGSVYSDDVGMESLEKKYEFIYE